MAGPWEAFAAPQTKNAPPNYPYEGPQAAANLQRTQQEVAQSEATASAKTAQAKAEAESARIKALTDKEQYDIAHPDPNAPGGTLTGQAYLQFLQKTDPGRAAYIQALSEGRAAFPGTQTMRSPAGLALLNQVMRADPTIDATNYTTRAAARKNAAVGNLSQSDNALITAVGHAGRLATLVPDVFGSEVTPLNSVANAVQSHFLGGKQPEYDQNANLLADEVAKAYGAGTGAERGATADQFSSSLATGQKTANIRGAIDLMLSKLAANRAQFAYGNGQLGKPDFMLLPQNVRDELQQAGASDLAKKYFSGVPVMGNGPGGGPGAFAPPPTGPTNGTPSGSGNGYSEAGDPQSAALWQAAAQQHASYSDALAAWQKDVKARGLTGVTPPTPGQYKSASDYIQKYPNVPYQAFSGVLRTPLTGVNAAMNNVSQSKPGAFAGHFANMASAGLPERLAGDQGQYFDAVSRQQHGTASMLGDIGGAIAGSVLAGKGAQAVAPGLSVARAATLGDIAYGTGTGAVQNPNHPMLGATLGAIAAGTGNVAGRYALGPALAAAGDTALGQGAVNAGRRLFNAPEPFAPPPALNGGQSMVLGQADKSGIDAITGRMQSAQDLNLPYALADADPRLRALAGSSVRKSPNMLSLADNVLTPRQAGQGERAIAQINNNLAPVVDVPTFIQNGKTAASKASNELYQDAYSQPTAILSHNPELSAVLDRPAAQSALRSAYARTLNEGKNPGDLSFATDPQGNPVMTGNPTWQTLHYARQALDDAGETATRRALDSQIGKLNPSFKQADQQYASLIAPGEAAQQGANATGIKVTPEAALAAFNAAKNNQPAFQKGYASNLADMIERQRLSGNPYNLVNGSMGQQAKMGIVFPEGSQNFSRAQGLEGDMAKTYTEALGGSQTAARTQADKAFDSADMALDLGQSVLTGVPPVSVGMTMLRKASNGALDNWRLGLGTSKADQIGPLLLNPDPAQNLLTLGDLVRMNATRRAYQANAGSLGAAIGSPLTLSSGLALSR